jgi:TetR/AcrR family tetracycline transcriptional repressor
VARSRNNVTHDLLHSRRREIIDNALGLLEEVGVDALTMRALGARMGIQAPSLYHHFSGKRELLTAMADRIVADAVIRPDVEDWEAGLRQCAYALRSTLNGRRDAVRVVAGTAATGPNSAAIAQAWTDALSATPLPLEERIRFALALYSFILGHMLEERGQPITSSEQDSLHTVGPLWRAYLAVAQEGAERRFDFGLDVIVAAIRTRVTMVAAPASGARKADR